MNKINKLRLNIAGYLWSASQNSYRLWLSGAGAIGCIVWGATGNFSDPAVSLMPAAALAMLLFVSWRSYQGRNQNTAKIVFTVCIVFVSGIISFAYQQPAAILAASAAFPALIYLGAGWTASLAASPAILAVIVFFQPQIGIIPIAYIAAAHAAQISAFAIFSSIIEIHRHRIAESIKKLRESNDLFRSKQAYLAGLSHQIRTPLSTIIGVADMLKSSELPLMQSEMVDTITSSANNLITLSDEILSNANLQPEGSNAASSIFDIKESVIEIAEEFNASGENLGRLIVKTNFSQYLPKLISGDDEMLRQVLLLVLKAVSDKGTGYPADADIFVYDKKETASSIEVLIEVHSAIMQETASQFKGLNALSSSEMIDEAGLNEAADKVISAGGSFELRHGRPGAAAVSFTMLFWKNNSDAVIVDKIQKAVKAASSKNQSRMQEAAILIAEDNLMNQKVVSMVLKNKVAKIDVASNGKEAVLMFSKSKYDLILMDLMMPTMDGYKAAVKIRELEKGTDMRTPIIALTANAQAGTRELCLEHGMDDFLTKPFKAASLLGKIEEYLMSIH
jgi:CheY-like chemotaxis protein